jgi:hypothetical protein
VALRLAQHGLPRYDTFAISAAAFVLRWRLERQQKL